MLVKEEKRNKAWLKAYFCGNHTGIKEGKSMIFTSDTDEQCWCGRQPSDDTRYRAAAAAAETGMLVKTSTDEWLY